MSKIYLEDIWIEDIFNWMYSHVTDSGGDGAVAIVCQNYVECCDWFEEWIRTNKKNDDDYYGYIREEGDSQVSLRDIEEVIIFTNDKNIFLYNGDYVFIVKEECRFGYCEIDNRRLISVEEV